MGTGHHYVTQHAVERVRQRWPAAALLEYKDLLALITTSVSNAEALHAVIRTPSGDYVPFALDGKRGFLVLKKDRVITALGEEYCPEVTEVMEKSNGSI